MSDPPPSPLAVTESRPLKWWYSKRPCTPRRGAHSARRHWRGVRGKAPGGHGWPRSSTSTEAPACASRQATTEPPKPDPMTTVSKRSGAIHVPRHRPPGIRLVGAEGAGANGRLQLATEARVLVGDAPDLAPQRARDVHAGAL